MKAIKNVFLLSVLIVLIFFYIYLNIQNIILGYRLNRISSQLSEEQNLKNCLLMEKYSKISYSNIEDFLHQRSELRPAGDNEIFTIQLIVDGKFNKIELSRLNEEKK